MTKINIKASKTGNILHFMTYFFSAVILKVSRLNELSIKLSLILSKEWFVSVPPPPKIKGT
jgi:hypothetical protein